MIAGLRQVKTRNVDLAKQSWTAGDLTGALEWWREAGVELDFSDSPRSWIAPPEPAPELPAAQPFTPPAALQQEAPPIALGGLPAEWPQDLATFQAWWQTEPALDNGQIGGRVPPRGLQGAALLVLVEQPEAPDGDALLSGPEGRLLTAILAAMAIPAEQVYFASALPRPMPMPDWDALRAAGLAELTAHHIALAAPQRVIAFGQNALPAHTSPLAGHDPANSAASLLRFNHEGASVPVMVAPPLAGMLARPRWKAAFWQRWLEWTGQKTT